MSAVSTAFIIYVQPKLEEEDPPGTIILVGFSLYYSLATDLGVVLITLFLRRVSSIHVLTSEAPPDVEIRDRRNKVLVNVIRLWSYTQPVALQSSIVFLGLGVTVYTWRISIILTLPNLVIAILSVIVYVSTTIIDWVIAYRNSHPRNSSL